MPPTSFKDRRAQKQQKYDGLRARGPVAAEFEDCQQSFAQLSDALHLSRLRPLVDKCWRNFNVWDNDSGASSRNLDYILKSSPAVRQQAISLLNDLKWTLEKAIAAAPFEEPRHEETSDLASLRSSDESNNVHLSIDVLEDEVDADVDFGPGPWVYEAFDIVDNLMQLLPTLRNPFEESVAPNAMLHSFECQSLESYQQVAQELLPYADPGLLTRMVNAQWLARRILPSANDTPLAKTESGKTMSTSRPLTHRHIQPSDRRLPAIRDSSEANSDRATSTARSQVETVLSRTAIAEGYSATSVEASSQSAPLRRPTVPRPPVDLDQLGTNSFDCPYCHCQLPLAVGSNLNPGEWADHFYQDVKPYICTFENCHFSDISFASRQEWFRHELDFHRTALLWICGFCETEFQDEHRLQDHLQSTHDNLPHLLDSDMVKKGCSRLSQSVSTTLECSLCRKVCGDLESLENHLGNHMEAFAILLADEYEPSTANNSDDREDREIRVMDFISEAAEAQAPSNNSHSVDASDFLNDDETRRQDLRQTGSNWKVTQFLESAKTKTVPHNLPAQYENFAGREQDLRLIHESLSSRSRVCVLTGVSGIGKTATAVEYAYRLGAEYSYVFWVEAESPGLLADKYASIADALGLSHDNTHADNSLIFRVRESLSSLDKDWLLIFDNVVAWTDISPYVAKALTSIKGSVLITTREDPLQSAPTWLYQHRFELGPLSTEHGREFLLTSVHPRLRKEDLDQDEDYPLAEKTVEILEGLPLAISMVVGYVKESRCTLSDFLEMWEEKELRSKKPNKINTIETYNVNNTVDSLWDIGIREVPNNSRKLLNILAFLNPDRIPKGLLVDMHEEDYLDLLHASESLSYNRMITKLKSRRLINIREEPNKETEYSIHRLLKYKIMLDMDDYSIADAFRSTFRLIRKKFPAANPQQVPNPTTWSTCQEYMPHIDSFHQVFTRERSRIQGLSAVQPLELVELFYDAGFYIWARRGTLYDGLNLLETAISILDEIKHNRDSKLRADINSILGVLLLEMGCEQRVQGTKHLDEVRRIRAVIYEQNPTDHDTDVLRMNAISDYTLCLMNYHEFDEAGILMVECFERYKLWGPVSKNPFENSKYYGNHSIVLMFQGKIDEAIQSVETCLDLTERFSGKGAQWYRRKFLLASIYLQAGELQNALNLHLEVLKARLELDGKHDANFILSLYAVGAMYDHLDNVEEAILYMKQCVECALNSQWSTVALARAEFHLALLYEKQGTDELEAQALRSKARQVLEQNREFAAECVKDSDDELMIFDDLQPTLLGRYTGTALLKHLQANLPRR
ncbi:Transcription activator GutR [Colletotrichum tropicale]|nr:Transcription activator GutR [Colletotrichum tropicale]